MEQRDGDMTEANLLTSKQTIRKASKRRRMLIVLMVTVIVLGSGVVATWFMVLKPTTLVSTGQRKQVSFRALYPTKSSDVHLDGEDAFHYFSANKFLVLQLYHEKALTKLVMSQQQLDGNNDEQEKQFEALLATMDEYGSLGSKRGKIHLTKPPQQNGKQVAALRSSDVTIFVRADDNLTDEQWRNFFESLVAQ